MSERHPINQNLMRPVQVVSDYSRQTIVNGEKINFKKGDNIKLCVTHIFQKEDNEYWYSLTLEINGATLKMDRTVMHTIDLVAEVMQLKEYKDDGCCSDPKPYCAVRHEGGEKLYKCKNCNTYLS